MLIAILPSARARERCTVLYARAYNTLTRPGIAGGQAETRLVSKAKYTYLPQIELSQPLRLLGSDHRLPLSLAPYRTSKSSGGHQHGRAAKFDLPMLVRLAVPVTFKNNVAQIYPDAEEVISLSHGDIYKVKMVGPQ